MKFNKLYHKGINGMITWEVWSDGAQIFTQFGQVGGKLQTTPGKLCEAKNTGKSNATTAVQQAELEAKAMYEHKLKRSYAPTEALACVPRFKPMLAHKFQDHKHKISYPVFVQPKLDGFR